MGSTAYLRARLASDRALFMDLKPGTQVKELLEKIPGLGPPESFDDIMIHVFINRKVRGFDDVLKHGDVVDVHIPVSGG